ncbi:MAG TPA: extracellular solute-binding protein [Pseudonocardiaceae bacterium]|nr:extracellular solute-binding protein [Pseudonocardiaceae bacterium]
MRKAHTVRHARLVGAASVVLTGTLVLAGCASGGGSSSASGGSGGNASSSNCFLSGSAPSAGPAGNPNGKTTITFMEAMSGGTLKSSLQRLTSQFEAANPNITVQLEESPDYGTLEKNEKDAVSAHKAPTIGQAYEGWAAEYARSGVIDTLDQMTGGASGTAMSALYSGVAADQKLCDGNTWMWPFNKSAYVNFYNPTMLQAAGQSGAPTTWAQFATDAESVSKNGVTGITIDPGGKGDLTADGVWFEILAEAYGTPVYDRNGIPQFNGPGVVKAMQYLADLKKSGALALGKNFPGETALGAQKGLFDISSVAGYSFEQQAVGTKFPLGTADLPAGPAKQANQVNGTNIVIFDSATAAQKQAAWKFMQFLTTPASQAYWATNTGYLPVTPAALDQMTSFLAKNPWMRTAAGALNHSSGSAPVPWADDTQDELSVALADVLTKGTDPKAALDKAQSDAMADMKASQ